MVTNKRTYLPLLLGALLLGACNGLDLTVPDYSNPALNDLLTNPTPDLVRQAATGILQGSRSDFDTYVKWTGILGHEGYFLDRNEPRYVTQLAAGRPRSTNFTGSSFWTLPYRNVRNAEILLAALDKVEMGQAEKDALRGLAKTFQAHDLLTLLNTRERIAIQLPSFDPAAPADLRNPAPLVSRAEAYAYISQRLDEGYADLQKAGNTPMPFPLPSGFTTSGFTTASKLAQANRGLKARIEAYRASELKGGAANYQNALQALNQSFITTSGAVDPIANRSLLNIGLYHSYSAGSGDVPNSLFDPSGRTVADRTIRRDAQLRSNGDRDARFVVKTDSASTSSVSGISSDLRFTIYNNRAFYGAGTQASPIPIIRNEELILLRAEARWFTGNRQGALDDLNFIRVNSGGLAPIAMPASDDAFITALLRERRYSLMFEGGHRWIDHRRFGRLAEIQTVSPSTATAIVASFIPLPSNEILARP